MRSIRVITLAFALTPAAHAADLKYIDPSNGIAKAVVVGEAPLVHTSQVYATDELGVPLTKQPPAEHAEKALANLDRLLKESGSSLEQAVKLNVYAETDDVIPAVRAALAKRFPAKAAPAACIVVGKLAHADTRVCIDAVAVSDGSVNRVLSKHLAKEPGRSHSVTLPPGRSIIYVAGQAERAKSIGEATAKTLASLDTTLRDLGVSRQSVIQVKSFLNPMADVGAVQKEMAEFFGAEAPAQVYVEWTYPQIEIELIAVGPPAQRGEQGETVSYFTPPKMTASPVYSRVAILHHGPRIYVSGLTGAGDDGAAQVKDIFAQLDGILKKAGSDLEHLAKATYYVSTEDASKKLNELRPNYYNPKRPPSASKAGVTSVGVAGRGIVLDMIAGGRR